MYYPDLSPYEYGHARDRSCQKLTIGWLGCSHGFSKGDVAEALLRKLFRLSRIGLDRMCGWHTCGICEMRQGGFPFVMDGQTVLLGDAEIEVCGKSGVIYRAPNLICHYIRDHHYKPPDEFLRALEEMDVPEEPGEITHAVAGSPAEPRSPFAPEVIYQEHITEVDFEPPSLAPRLRKAPTFVSNARRLIFYTEHLSFATKTLETAFADRFASTHWYVVCSTKMYHTGNRYAVAMPLGRWMLDLVCLSGWRRLTWVYEYPTLAGAAWDASRWAVDGANSGILGTSLSGEEAARHAVAIALDSRRVLDAFTNGAATFYALLIPDDEGVDLYWHKSNEDITASAKRLADSRRARL